MEKIIEDDNLDVFENKNYIRVRRKSNHQATSYEYTNEMYKECMIHDSKESKIRKIDKENILIGHMGSKYIIGNHNTMGCLRVRLPKYFSELVDKIEITGKYLLKHCKEDYKKRSVFQEEYSFDNLLKGQQYSLIISFQDGRKIKIYDIEISDYDILLNLSDMMQHSWDISIPDCIDEGVLEVARNSSMKIDKFDINRETIRFDEIIFRENEEFKMSHKEAESYSISDDLIFSIMPDNYRPIKRENITGDIKVQESELKGLIDLEMKIPKLINEDLEIDVNSKYSVYEWSHISNHDNPYFKAEDNQIKNCIPGHRFNIKLRHPNCSFSKFSIIVSENRVVKENAVVNEEETILGWNNIKDELSKVKIQLHCNLSGYVLVNRGLRNTHHSSGVTKNYSVKTDSRLKIIGRDGSTLNINVNWKTAIQNNIIISDSVKGF